LKKLVLFLPFDSLFDSDSQRIFQNACSFCSVKPVDFDG